MGYSRKYVHTPYNRGVKFEFQKSQFQSLLFQNVWISWQERFEDENTGFPRVYIRNTYTGVNYQFQKSLDFQAYFWKIPDFQWFTEEQDCGL